MMKTNEVVPAESSLKVMIGLDPTIHAVPPCRISAQGPEGAASTTSKTVTSVARHAVGGRIKSDHDVRRFGWLRSQTNFLLLFFRKEAFALLFLLFGHPATAADWVVSLNLCTDQLLGLLAPEKIAGLTPLARDPAISYIAEMAKSFPVVRPSAEAVLALLPDLVMAGPYGAQATIALLRERGVTVLQVGLPQSFGAIRTQLRQVADALGVPERGENLEREMDALLDSVQTPLLPHTAVFWGARGQSSGPGSLGDAVLVAAGYDDIGTGRGMALETLALHPPDLLVVPQTPAFPSLATDLLLHPAVSHIPRITVPPSLLICGGPWTALAVRLLAQSQ